MMIKNNFFKQKGQALIEYSLIITLVAVIIIGILVNVGNTTKNSLMTPVASAVSNVSSASSQ